MTMATVPYRELQFDAQGSGVTIHGLSLRDYPQAVRFYKWQSGERQ